jgi:hypothetical protein
LKIICKLKGGATAWKESKHTSLVDKAKKRVRETIKEQTGMIIDRPDSVAGGTTTTGNTAARCFINATTRQVLIDCVTRKVESDGE